MQMVTKCFNSSCSASFRFLHSGKLFQFEKRTPHLSNRKFDVEPSSGAELFWLCEKCATEYKLQWDPENGVRVISLSRALLKLSHSLPVNGTAVLV